MEITQVLSMFDGYLALGILFWLVMQGLTRFDKLAADRDLFMADILKNQQENNRQLMMLLEVMCAERHPKTPKD